MVNFSAPPSANGAETTIWPVVQGPKWVQAESAKPGRAVTLLMLFILNRISLTYSHFLGLDYFYFYLYYL